MNEDEENRECLNNFKGFACLGNYYSAVCELADVYYRIPHMSLSEVKRIEPELEGIEINSTLLQAARDALKERKERIDRITSIGSRWDIDEISLLLHLRIEIDILSYFLDKFGDPLEVDLSEIDFWFASVSVSLEHKRAFDSAACRLRKNWRAATYTRWV